MIAKIKGKGKRVIAGVLIGVSLFTATVEPFYQVEEVQAMTGASTALYTLFTMIMAACGVSCGSKSQNNSLCDAFSSWFDDVKAGKEVVDGIVFGNAADEMSSLKGIAAGKHFALSSFPTIVKLMKYFIQKVAPKYVGRSSYKGTSKASYGKTFYSSKSCKDTLDYICDTLNLDMADRVSYYSDSSNIRYVYDRYLSTNNMTFLCANVSKDQCTLNLYFDSTQYYPVYSYVLVNNGSYIYKKSNPTESNFLNREYFYYCMRCTRSSIASSSWSLQVYEGDYRGYCSSNPSDGSDNYISTQAQIFTSYEQFQNYVISLNRYKLIEGLYGDTSKTFDYPSNYQATAGDESLADAITQGVSEALAASQAGELTSEEISAIISANIVDYSKQLDEIQGSLEEVNNSSVLTNSWLSKIYEKVSSISATVSKFDVSAGGTVSLDESDAFGLGSYNPEGDNDDGDPKVWLPGAIGIASFLLPLVKYFAEPISQITKWLSVIRDNVVGVSDVITSSVVSVVDGITDLPQNIWDKFQKSFEKLLEYLGQMVETSVLVSSFVSAYPLDIVTWISTAITDALADSSIDVSIPDVNVDIPSIEIPILSDILAVLQAIALSVSNFFVIDTDVLDATMEAQQDKVEDKLPFTPAIALFDSIKFSDDYDYPVLKMQSPDVIKQFTGSEYIVLFDGQNFAQYFKVVRGLLTAFLWISYAYVIIRKFKVQITLD